MVVVYIFLGLIVGFGMGYLIHKFRTRSLLRNAINRIKKQKGIKEGFEDILEIPKIKKWVDIKKTPRDQADIKVTKVVARTVKKTVKKRKPAKIKLSRSYKKRSKVIKK